VRALALALARRAAPVTPAALTALTALVVTALAACEERQAHLFYAQRYDPEQGCLGPAEAVEVLDGPDPGPCGGPRCFRTPAGDVLVTTGACDAPPDYVDGTGDAPGSTCAAALEALETGARCEP
jgi:hypothetical protein